MYLRNTREHVEHWQGVSDRYLELAKRMYAHPRRYGFFSEDEISDALSRYRTRIDRILQRVEEQRITGPGFLCTSMRFVARSMHRQQWNESLCENAYIYHAEPEEMLLEKPADAFISEPDPVCYQKGSHDLGIPIPILAGTMSPERRRVLVLMLKCAWEIDDATVQKASVALGLPLSTLETLLALARSRSETNYRLLCAQDEKMRALWIRLRVLEMRYETVFEPEEKARIRKRLAFCRTRYRILIDRRKRRRSPVSNECIASLLGIPKGSVDSGLFYLRKQAKEGLALAEYMKLE
ncbi:MAG: hypothetical protein N3A02_07215 [Rectinema sp.]|nr:hypothetical protein [Rectinema sp.]